jgi:hypothetical protein
MILPKALCSMPNLNQAITGILSCILRRTKSKFFSYHIYCSVDMQKHADCNAANLGMECQCRYQSIGSMNSDILRRIQFRIIFRRSHYWCPVLPVLVSSANKVFFSCHISCSANLGLITSLSMGSMNSDFASNGRLLRFCSYF